MVAKPEADKPEGPDRRATLRVAVGVVVLAAIGALGLRSCLDALRETDAPAADEPDDAAAPTVSAAPPRPALCAAVGPDASFTIGEAPAPPRPAPDAGEPGLDDEPEGEPDLTPFAVEVGRGAAYDGGFAAGALRDGEGGSVASVVTVGRDGKNGKIVRLGRSRGDLEAPVVAGLGGSILAGMIEPNAGGRAIKVARVTGDKVEWGVELAEGRDESLAFDLAASGATAAAAWDDVTRDGRRAVVKLAVFDPGAMRVVTPAQPVSDPRADAEQPRLVARPGGYWLAYVVRAEAPRQRREHGEEGSGEVISTAWLEVAALDERGTTVAAPRALTPKDGHVLAFDAEAGEGGGVVLAYRDDDTPTGSSGGRVSAVFASLGGAGEPRLVADEDVGAGVPDLLPGWIAVSDLRGPKRLAPMSARGEPLSALDPERSIGAGDPIAASGDLVLVARPTGRAMRLEVLRCAAAPAAPAPSP
jgi:hypothetical protein